MKYIDEVSIRNKRVLLRADYNVPFSTNHHVLNDEKIRQSMPTITHLLQANNTVIILTHLGRPKDHEESLSLKHVVGSLKRLLNGYEVNFAEDIDTLAREIIRIGNPNRVILLENIRYFKGEDKNDPAFAKKVARLGDIYVNDAFSVSHRKSASVVGLPALLPSYAGLLMKKEIKSIDEIIKKPRLPLVSIMGGAKISTKIHLIKHLIDISSFVLLGGGLANTFLLALKNEVGRSLVEKHEVKQALELIDRARTESCRLLLPTDVVVGSKDGKHALTKSVHMLSKHDTIYDIGPETQAIFAQAILQAETIIWNGPLGYFEESAYQKGTDFIYYAVTLNKKATSLVGGGETLASIADKEGLEHITHISTAGGALLEYIEKGTLPGIEALKHSRSL